MLCVFVCCISPIIHSFRFYVLCCIFWVQFHFALSALIGWIAFIVSSLISQWYEHFEVITPSFVYILDFRTCLGACGVKLRSLMRLWHYNSCELTTTVTSLQLWPHYSCDLTTVVTSLQLWAHYSCDLTTAVSSLQFWAHYSCDLTTVVTSLQLWPLYSCDLTTVVNLLQLWPYYYCDLTTVVLTTVVSSQL